MQEQGVIIIMNKYVIKENLSNALFKIENQLFDKLSEKVIDRVLASITSEFIQNAVNLKLKERLIDNFIDKAFD